MGKDEKKKTHSKFHCDQMNGSWLEIGKPTVEDHELIPLTIFENIRPAETFFKEQISKFCMN